MTSTPTTITRCVICGARVEKPQRFHSGTPWRRVVAVCPVDCRPPRNRE